MPPRSCRAQNFVAMLVEIAAATGQPVRDREEIFDTRRDVNEREVTLETCGGWLHDLSQQGYEDDGSVAAETIMKLMKWYLIPFNDEYFAALKMTWLERISVSQQIV